MAFKHRIEKILKDQGWGISRSEETPTAPASSSFKSVQFPAIRKAMPSLFANEIVSVQPMSVPSGLLFYTDYVYGKYSKPVYRQLKRAGLKVDPKPLK